MKNRPIKRSSELVALSRDHHEGLLLCWKVRTGITMNIELQRLRDYILYFFDRHLLPHFKEEEDLVFSSLADEDQMKITALEQHKSLCTLIADMNNVAPADTQAFTTIADLLDKHIRFEERELFPYVESTLPKEKLKELGTNISKIHKKKIDLNWDDQFWIKEI